MTGAAATKDDLLAGLDVRLPSPTLPVAYLVGLLLVSVAMFVLPLLYLGLVAASGWAVYWWATEGFGLLFHGSVSSTRIRLFAYVAPLICGGAVPLFLVKPLFSRRGAAPAERHLERREQPLLFAFVERLAALVGAPVPDRIVLDCQVNAGAGLELGLLKREGTALVLTIGLPLVAGLTLPQFASVLAHEFGHFGQGAGMYLTRIIRAVNFWFQRVVYERDDWDEALAQGRQDDGWWAIICLGAQVLVGVGRKILYGLMVAGHGISCYLTRQMEFDADQYGARVAGSAVFADTSMRVRVLAAAADFVSSSVLNSDRLADDLPGLIARVADQAPPRLMTAIRMDVQRSGTGLFDTHPSDLERIRRARAARFPGILSYGGPATALFRDFPGVCRRATLDLYEASLGVHAPGADALLPVDAFIEAPAPPSPAGESSLEFPRERPPRLSAHVAVREDAAVARMTDVRQRLRTALPAATAAAARFDRAQAHLLDASLAEALLAAGLTLDPREFSLPAATSEGVERTRSRALSMQAEADRDLEPAERALAERLGLAMGVLASGAAQLPDAPALRQEAQGLLQALPALERAQVEAGALRREAVVLHGLLANQRNRMGHVGLDHEIDRRLSEVRRALQAVRAAAEGVALDGWSWDVPPPWRDDPDSHLKSALRALEILDMGHAQIVGRLTEIADRVEGLA